MSHPTEPNPPQRKAPRISLLDLNRDGHITRDEIAQYFTRDTLGKLLEDSPQGRRLDCEDAKAFIPRIENTLDGATQMLAKGTKAQSEHAAQTIAERTATTINEQLGALAKRQGYPEGRIESVEGKDLLPAVRVIGKAMEVCGLTGQDAPIPDTETPDHSLYATNTTPKTRTR